MSKDQNKIKVVIPAIAREVGTTAAMLLQHINYWMFTQNKNKIYRTNGELVDDLNGMFSIFQIQYAKKKLVDNGFLTLSFEKGCDRTTHYTFTEKALNLLKEHTEYMISKTDNKTSRKTHVDRSYNNYNDNSGTVVPKTENIAVKACVDVLEAPLFYDYNDQLDDFKINTPKQPVQQTNKSMQRCFEEQGKKRKDVVKGVPDSLKHLVKSKQETVHTIDISPLNEDDTLPIIENIDEFLKPINESELSDNGTIFSSKSANETLDTISVFKRPPNIDLFEKRRIINEQMLNYKEEY